MTFGRWTTERCWLLLLCGVAAARVLVFLLAFPFFTNVDEESHFDLVVKYSHGQISGVEDTMLPESARFISYYRAPEYWKAPQEFPDGRFPAPPWLTPPEQIRGSMAAFRAQWEEYDNHEAAEPPLYYTLAGAWMNLGRLAGLTGANLLYWVRVINVPLAVLAVWLAHVAARMVFPDDPWYRFAAPALIALMPQSAWYQISNDVLSPVCFALGFIGVVQLWKVRRPTYLLAVSVGLAIAASLMAKMMSNAPLAVVALGMIAARLYTLAREGRLRPAVPAYLALAAGAVLPVAGWLAWRKSHFGDFTGAAAKIEFLGWTFKPVSSWFDHPIFTPGGAWEFWSGTIASFWRGELVWSLKPIGWPPSDAFYRVSTLVVLAVAAARLLRPMPEIPQGTRRALAFALASFVAAVGNLAFLSIVFDYGDCSYPSAEHPFFVSGRLATGAMIPFALLYVWAIARLPGRLGNARTAIVALILVLLAVSQVQTNRVAFPSRYNWFHTPASAVPPD